MPDAVLLLLLAKMACAALIVVSVSVIAERSGPMLAAMIATLPVSAGPIYVFLALEHDAQFISGAALGSMGSNLSTTMFILVYVLAAQRFGTVVSLAGALAAWLIAVAAFKGAALPFAVLLMLTATVFPLMHWLARPYLAARPDAAPQRPWYAIPMRAAAVALLVAIVSAISARVGATWSGMLATFPIVLSSLVAILHPRIGGPATAALMGSGLLGLMGFGFALATLHQTAPVLGSGFSLAIGLAICLVWNLALTVISRRRR